jgi:hypothetical protein
MIAPIIIKILPWNKNELNRSVTNLFEHRSVLNNRICYTENKINIHFMMHSSYYQILKSLIGENPGWIARAKKAIAKISGHPIQKSIMHEHTLVSEKESNLNQTETPKLR